MVRWYNPLLLLKAGARSAITTIVGSVSDNRELRAALAPIPDDGSYGVYDYCGTQTEGSDGLWIDYVADLGDGYEPTFAVADALATEVLEHERIATKRARILVMGGDQVYNDPFNNAYEERLTSVYREASERHSAFAADLFAVPGNHDWYDGLREFTNLFCEGDKAHISRPESGFGSWQPKQSRSYFALKLPNDWWLCGVDVQLDTRLNGTQLSYFEEIASNVMTDNAKIILCVAQPSWSTNPERPVEDLVLDQITRIFQAVNCEIKLVLAGDVHHYSRYSPNESGPELVTAGGGGAFLHPTHQLPQSTQLNLCAKQHNYERKTTFPSTRKSRQLTYRNLLFPLLNLEFALLIGLVYAMMTWFLETRRQLVANPLENFVANMIGDYSTITATLSNFIATIPKSPEFAALVIGMHAALLLFNGKGPWIVRHALALLHSMAHFLAMAVGFCFAALMCPYLSVEGSGALANFIVFFLLVFISGTVVGGLIFGFFLTLTLNVFGLQYNNAFSSLRIADYKNFVRLHIGPSGMLTIYPFKIERVGKARTDPVSIEAPFSIE